jgi:hypothetical protein
MGVSSIRTVRRFEGRESATSDPEMSIGLGG